MVIFLYKLYFLYKLFIFLYKLYVCLYKNV